LEKVEDLADSIFVAVKGYVDKFAAVLAKRVDEMDSRIAVIPAGKDGAPGRDGEKGLDGAVGEKGEPGVFSEPGAVGDKGEPGQDGLSGKDGAPGMAGIDGVHGKDGEPGINGRDGREGRDGSPGRDALELDILSAIDPVKAYSRGTWARHAGGLVRAARNTDPVVDGAIAIAGWDVMVDGVASVSAEWTGDRELVVRTITTGGKVMEQKSIVPVLIYRNVYKSGSEYQRGDTVTWDGSTWHCERTTKGEPGNGADWKLMVKRGSPGKDGVSVKGETGSAGRDGKDLTQMDLNGNKYR